MTEGMGIREVAERTGLAAGTIRMWEQRYGFPRPERSPSGYRRYRPEDVSALRRAIELRGSGLSVTAAIDRAREAPRLSTDRPSIYAAVLAGDLDVPPRRLRKSTLVAMSRAIEDEALARAAAPVLFGAFQEEPFYRHVEHRYVELARVADAVTVFADFPEVRVEPRMPAEVPLGGEDALGNEWAVIVDAPGFAACLLAWEPPTRRRRGGPDDPDRRFETLWTLDPEVTREAARVAAHLAGRQDRDLGERLAGLLEDRPLASERPSAVLTSLTNRMLAYVEDGVGPG
jgi:DICT domain-containing protein